MLVDKFFIEPQVSYWLADTANTFGIPLPPFLVIVILFASLL